MVILRGVLVDDRVALVVVALADEPAEDASRVIDMRFVKPLDQTRLSALLSEHSLWITLEENVVAGGAGSGVNEWLAAQESSDQINILNLGLADGFIDHGDATLLRAQAGLDSGGLIRKIQQRLDNSVKAEK